MEIFVVFKAYRQKEGEYLAIEVESAFPKKEDADAYMKDKPWAWWETKNVPVDTGGSMPVEFKVWRAIHTTELKGM